MANLNFCTQRIKSSLVFLSIPKLILENYLDLIKIYFYMDTSHLQMFQKLIDLLKFLNTYGTFWVPPGESACPDISEYVWQRRVESLQGRVTAGQS